MALLAVTLAVTFLARTFANAEQRQVESVIEPTGKVTQQDQHDECKVWFAKSTIPGGGLGMFAGIDFAKGQALMTSGDVCIPVVDIDHHHNYNNNRYKFLWDEYTWNSATLQMDNEGHDVHAICTGFGSAANSNLNLINVDEDHPTQDDGSTGLHRTKDPGAGAFTEYHDRKATANSDIMAGHELFVSYGNNWFATRSKQYGSIPLKGDYGRAMAVLIKFQRLQDGLNGTHSQVLEALQDRFLVHKPTESSTILNAIPDTREELELAMNETILGLRKRQATVSLEWLQQYGTCASNLYESRSTIAQAGRGAFASRDLQKGSVVAPLPLVHLVQGKKQCEMYDLVQQNKSILVNRTAVVGHQLLLNYCFGHKDSTLLLCPYGLLTSLVNHNAKHPNVKLAWANPQRSNHQPEWLFKNKTLKELKAKNSAVLAMEFVAIRDIQKDEEIVMDYGKEWQDAWNLHVQHWKQPHSDCSHYLYYKAAHEFNQDKTGAIRTEFERLENPYPDNIDIKCNSIFKNKVWMNVKKKKGQSLEAFIKESDSNEVVTCDVLRRIKGKQHGAFEYTVVFYSLEEKEDKQEPRRVDQVPREAFWFVDKLMTSDMHLNNTFRHEMMIPDELFPEQWKDLLKK